MSNFVSKYSWLRGQIYLLFASTIFSLIEKKKKKRGYSIKKGEREKAKERDRESLREDTTDNDVGCWI